MRDEWTTSTAAAAAAEKAALDSRSSRGLTRVGRQTESSRAGGLDRSASLTLAHKGMRLKSKGLGDLKNREVSERRQVGDVESVVNAPSSMDEARDGRAPWWRNVGMEEGL